MQQRTVIVIAGPTAVGKTAIAVEVAQRFNTSIISADSRQCYQGMAIGTAQPTANELAAVRHYFVDAFPVTTPLNAADFEQLSLGYLEDIFQESDTAVVCGGTGLYVRALCEGLDAMPAVDEAIRLQTEAEYTANGIQWLQEQTKSTDPAFAEGGDMANPARMLRALIFARSTGESILQYRSARKKTRPFRIIKVGLELPRELLYQRINHRVDTMIAAGFLAEAEALYPLRHLKNLQTVGYVELFNYLSGHTPLEGAVELIKQHTRNYAKRQLTWFRKDPEFVWLPADAPDVAGRIAGLL